jgi:hypothetical protein
VSRRASATSAMMAADAIPAYAPTSIDALSNRLGLRAACVDASRVMLDVSPLSDVPPGARARTARIDGNIGAILAGRRAVEIAGQGRMRRRR